MAKNIHRVIDSRGKEHRRVSINHVYAYAVVAHYPARKSVIDARVTWPAKSEACWTTSIDLAGAYKRERERWGAELVEIISVTPEQRP